MVDMKAFESFTSLGSARRISREKYFYRVGCYGRQNLPGLSINNFSISSALSCGFGILHKLGILQNSRHFFRNSSCRFSTKLGFLQKAASFSKPTVCLFPNLKSNFLFRIVEFIHNNVGFKILIYLTKFWIKVEPV